MAGEVVHDDDRASRELGDQHLFHIGLEGIAVDGAVEHPWRDHATRGQTSHKGGGFPMAMRYANPQALPAGAAAMGSRHIC